MSSERPNRAGKCGQGRCGCAGGGSGKSVLVLGGGPDAEREVSLVSSRAVAAALEEAGYRVHREEIERLTQEELGAMPGEVVFPVLHGSWGEGGALQDLLELDGRAFVGSRSQASRLAMDKVATKFAALKAGIPSAPMWILDRRDTAPPCCFPLIIKPVHEGSTVGLYVCRTLEEWARARERIDQEAWGSADTVAGGRTYMIEPMIGGNVMVGGGEDRARGGARELTVGVIDDTALPVIEIVPRGGLYDYEAKYASDETRYVVDPELPKGVKERISEQTVRLGLAMGVRHIARADFMLDVDGTAWFLEINTMPGFTGHSLVPMAARRAGLEIPELCARLVEMAKRDLAAVRLGGVGV